MKTSIKKKITIFISVIFFSCQTKTNHQKNELPINSTENTSNLIYDSAYSSRPFIVNSIFKASVYNCNNMADSVEQFVLANKGFILLSNSIKNVTKTFKNEISIDSVQLIEYYQPVTSIKARLPVTKLNRFLQYVKSLTINLELRYVEATDVKFDLALQNNEIKDGNYEQKDKNKRIYDIATLTDNTQLATIEMTFKEPEKVQVSPSVNTSKNWDNEISFWKKASMKIQIGFQWLLQIILFLLQFWWILPSYLLVAYLLKKLRFR